MLLKETSVAANKNAVRESLASRYERVRKLTIALIENLSDADASAQSMTDASPAKWHLAHTTWFFETFVLADHRRTYCLFDERFPYLFNSYYETKGARIGRAIRGLITRPTLDEILSYRRYVDEALKDALTDGPENVLSLVELGCHHEQQHQELLITDILHLFAQNPLNPALWPARKIVESRKSPAMEWIAGKKEAVSIGHSDDGFAFDCEGPRHIQWLVPHALANRLVTNDEWLAFIKDGGYNTANHWLSDGWAWVKQNEIEAPLYWRRNDEASWVFQFGLNGLTALDGNEPVQHVSFYEADAFARWAGARLPTESEWESAAISLDSQQGNFLDKAGPVGALPAVHSRGLTQMFGDLWEWTNSGYLAYPGFKPSAGAVGEYNGKFMSGQFVLKGGSCATPRGHVRPSYRNFFYPHQRWQFTGVRLAKDL